MPRGRIVMVERGSMNYRPLCRNCGRTIHRVFRYLHFGQRAAARYHRSWSFQDFPDSIAEVERLAEGTVLSVEWVSDIEHWIKRAVVWDGEYTSPYFCGRGCAQLFGYHQAATGAATDMHAEAVMRQRAKLDEQQLRRRRKARRSA